MAMTTASLGFPFPSVTPVLLFIMVASVSSASSLSFSTTRRKTQEGTKASKTTRSMVGTPVASGVLILTTKTLLQPFSAVMSLIMGLITSLITVTKSLTLATMGITMVTVRTIRIMSSIISTMVPTSITRNTSTICTTSTIRGLISLPTIGANGMYPLLSNRLRTPANTGTASLGLDPLTPSTSTAM